MNRTAPKGIKHINRRRTRNDNYKDPMTYTPNEEQNKKNSLELANYRGNCTSHQYFDHIYKYQLIDMLTTKLKERKIEKDHLNKHVKFG